MREKLAFSLGVPLLILAVLALTVDAGTDKSGRAISVFNVVKFQNDRCNGTSNKFGTCYTEQECEDREGKSEGSCADGYGVCCIFTLECGDMSSENCTYFESSSAVTGACNTKICKSNDNICQIRLDFTTFEITGPSTVSTSMGKVAFGILADGGGKEVATMGQCITDSFYVAVPGSKSTPVICGKNTGQHLYVEPTEACALMSFQLGASSSVTRTWNIKIAQYSCDYDNLAPRGCLQYFFGSNTGQVKSFNYDDGLHLANQDQNICVRRELGYCKICWSAATTAFDVSSMGADDAGIVQATTGQCCGFGADGMKTSGYDCVIIPDAVKNSANSALKPSSFCGRGLATDAAALMTTVCSKRTPFQIRFLSDNFEYLGEAGKNPNGFALDYTQVKC